MLIRGKKMSFHCSELLVQCRETSNLEPLPGNTGKQGRGQQGWDSSPSQGTQSRIIAKLGMAIHLKHASLYPDPRVCKWNSCKFRENMQTPHKQVTRFKLTTPQHEGVQWWPYVVLIRWGFSTTLIYSFIILLLFYYRIVGDTGSRCQAALGTRQKTAVIRKHYWAQVLIETMWHLALELHSRQWFLPHSPSQSMIFFVRFFVKLQTLWLYYCTVRTVPFWHLWLHSEGY